MEPVPLWARVLGVLAGILTAPLLVFTVLAGTASLASVTAEVHRTWSLDVGPAPRLQLDIQYGNVVVQPGQDGRVVVQQDLTVEAVTRAAASLGLGAAKVGSSQGGGTVSVSQQGPGFQPLSLSHGSTITVRVPTRTDLAVTGATGLTVHGLDGSVRIDGAAVVDLRDMTLRGDSKLNVPTGAVVMRNITVAGSTILTKQVGRVQFDGTLAPGGSSLDIEAGAGGATVSLPHPTDARAVVSTQLGNLNADPAWHFTPVQVSTPRRWVADLGPNPTGTVTVQTTIGDIQFNLR